MPADSKATSNGWRRSSMRWTPAILTGVAELIVDVCDTMVFS
jgi:hypothetical protein